MLRGTQEPVRSHMFKSYLLIWKKLFNLGMIGMHRLLFKTSVPVCTGKCVVVHLEQRKDNSKMVIQLGG